jgi:integrase
VIGGQSLPKVTPLSAALARRQDRRRLGRAAPHGMEVLSHVPEKRRAGVTGLRFHDRRHEAVSRFFEKGLSMPEVASISGHRDPRMLMRYTHPKAEDIAPKLC